MEMDSIILNVVRNVRELYIRYGILTGVHLYIKQLYLTKVYIKKKKKMKKQHLLKNFPIHFTLMNPPINISDSFEKSFVEGVKCLNVGAPFASVVMFRKCLQIIAEDKGATRGTLKKIRVLI